MKKIILFLCFCLYSYCTGQPDRLKDKASVEISGMVNDTKSPQRIAKLRIIENRVEHEAAGFKSLEIHMANGSTKMIDCVKTDGILIDSDTPVWRSERADTPDEIMYTPIMALKELGKFKFCQNIEYKVAVAIFHDQQIVDLYVEDDHTMLGKISLHSNNRHEYSSLPRAQSSDHDTSGIRLADRVKRDIKRGPFRRDPPPATVYPQLLIQLDVADVRRNLMVALMRMLSYWNAVDLLYRSLKQPKIKLNIAGIIVPGDNFSTPWITNAKNAESDNFIDRETAIIELGYHFEDNSHVFPDDKYDFMISFVSDQLDEDGEVFGISAVNTYCTYRTWRVVLMRNYLDTTLIAAHELGHLFSAGHDDVKEECKDSRGIMTSVTSEADNLDWSSCSRDSIQHYFKTMRSTCLDNCPRTKPNCEKDQIPLHKFFCVLHPVDLCRATRWPIFSGNIDCKRGVTCTRDTEWDDYCAKYPLSFIRLAFCRSMDPMFPRGNPKPLNESIIPVVDGTLCGLDASGSISACYSGNCVPVELDTPHCGLK